MDAGLEQIIAAETTLSDVDGMRGRLVICGYELNDLVEAHNFEGVLSLLWSRFFGKKVDSIELSELLGHARVLAFKRLAQLPHANAIETMRMGLCLSRDGDDLEAAIDLIATCAVATAMSAAQEKQCPPTPPDPSLSHAADMLRMIVGRMPSSKEVRALDTYLMSVSDHGLNASTFAARVVASTKAGLPSAVIAGLSALKGPLHGGAPGPVLDMLDAIGTPEAAEAWIENAFKTGERLMGFGHRVYRVRDPRADALKHAVATLPATQGRLAFASAIENKALVELAKRYPKRSLETNVEFYTALLLEALGIPRPLFTPVFACGRVGGWVAHAKEQLATKRLIRPMSVYVGDIGLKAA